MELNNTIIVQSEMSANMFVEALRKGYDLYELYEYALTSETGSIVYCPIQTGQWCGAKYVLSLFEFEHEFKQGDGHIKNEDVIYWIGYLLRFWNFYRPQDSSEDIYNMLSLDDWFGFYSGFHCLSPEMAIDDMVAWSKEEKHSH